MSSKFHLRVTTDRTNGAILAGMFVSKFKPNKYMFAFEKVGDNEHIHGHLEYKTIPTKQQISEFMKPIKQKLKPDSKAPIHWHKELQKDAQHNILYVAKDDDILTHNFTEEEIQNIKEENERIEEEKKTPMKTQLVNHCKTEGFNTLAELANMINDYHVERDYLPPTSSLLRQYVIYVALKLKRCEGNVQSMIENNFVF